MAAAVATCGEGVEGAFGPWQELAAARPPAVPGVFQIRLGRGLLALPGGRSAMVFYGAGGDLARAVADFRTGILPGLPWAEAELRVRWRPATDPDGLLAALLARFRERFGALPPGNAAGPVSPPSSASPGGGGPGPAAGPGAR